MKNGKYKSILQDVISALKPPKNLTVSEWADEYRYLSSSGSAESGKFYTNRTEYFRTVMDCINIPEIEMITFMSSAQLGKSETLLNVIGYFVHIDPSPIMVVFPNASDGEEFSKSRISPMFEDTPVLKNTIIEDTIRMKTFRGGYINVTGSNSASKLASKPIRVVLLDECSRLSQDVDGEGNAIELAIKRTTTFYNRKIIMTSTPTIKDADLIELYFNKSESKNRYYVKCPTCNHEQNLVFSNVKWEKDENGNADPETSYYECEECKAHLTDGDINRMVKSGRWITDGEDTFIPKKSVGFHLWEIYSPFVTMEEIVRKFLEAKNNSTLMRSFVNLSLGETFDDSAGEELNENLLYNRREDYYSIGSDIIPAEVLVVTMGVDTQDDRLEYQIVGWGHGEESWVLDYGVLYGNPAENIVWNQLREIIETVRFTTELGIDLRIVRTFIDKGGHHSDAVLKFVYSMRAKNVFAIYGSNQFNHPILPKKASTNNNYKVPVFQLGVTAAKESVFSRLKIDTFGSGYVHFNKRLDEDYFKQLTAEKMVARMSNGRYVKAFKKIRSRNEALDTFVYSYAAMLSLNVNFETLQKKFENMSISSVVDALPSKQYQNEKEIDLKPFEEPICETSEIKRRGKYTLVSKNSRK